MNQWRKDSYIDVINFLLGVALFISPWVIGITGGTIARTAWISGILIVIAALLALFAFAEWEEWANLILGLWVLISPWVVGFASTSSAATKTNVVIGIIVAVLSAWELWRIHSSTPPPLRA